MSRMPPEWSTQSGFDVRFDWGVQGIERLGPHVRAIVIVDVLRFTTAVETAVSAGVTVIPHRYKAADAARHAASLGAALADGSGATSLSPASLARLPAGSRVVLPSPNGAVCSLRAQERGALVLAGCLRNATAVAGAALRAGGPVGVIACGELWHDGSLRPALEDLLGAAAVIAALPGSRSPEAEAALAVHRALGADIGECASARELRERGLGADVEWAAQLDASRTVPVLRGGEYRAAEGPR